MNILSLPAIYALEITPVCNSRCPGCSNVYAAERDAAAPLSAREWRQLLAPFIDEAVQIRLTGGEPTLHPEFYEILDEVTSHQAWVTVFTNGRWRKPKQFVRRIAGRRNLSGLLVSLHGASPATHEAWSGVPGSFRETVSNIRLAVEHGITVALSTILTRYSCGELKDVVRLARDLGVHHIAINRYIGRPLPEVEPTREELRSAILEIQELARAGAPLKYGIGVPQCFASNDSEGCLAGVAYVSIDPWGRLRPCAHSPCIIGSLQDSAMEDLWQGPRMEHWRSMMPDECTRCAAFPLCHGGCRAIQELRPDRRDPLRCALLQSFERPSETHNVPASGRPQALVRLREELFGYAVLGEGQVMLVRREARNVIEACNGERTFEDLATQFGQVGLDLLGELWTRGMLTLI